MKKVSSFSQMSILKQRDRVLVLDSGGLDSKFLICKILEYFPHIHVKTLTLNIGQQDQSPIELPNSIESRIERFHIDAISEFCDEYVLPHLQMTAMYQGQHPLSASLSRPLIAKHLVKLGQSLNIDCIFHSATPSQNSMRRFNQSIIDLGFEGYYGSPYEDNRFSRVQKTQYLETLGACVSESRFYSFDSNHFCREFESGSLINPHHIEFPNDNYTWTQHAKKDVLNIKLEFENGIPCRLNNELIKLCDLIEYLNYNVGAMGLGRYKGLEESPQALKVLEVRESPAAMVLIDAYRQLLSASFTFDQLAVRNSLEQIWLKEVSEGRWYGLLKQSIESFNKNYMNQLSGEICYQFSSFGMEWTHLKTKKPVYSLNREELEDNVQESLKEVA